MYVVKVQLDGGRWEYISLLAEHDHAVPQRVRFASQQEAVSHVLSNGLGNLVFIVEREEDGC